MRTRLLAPVGRSAGADVASRICRPVRDAALLRTVCTDASAIMRMCSYLGCGKPVNHGQPGTPRTLQAPMGKRWHPQVINAPLTDDHVVVEAPVRDYGFSPAQHRSKLHLTGSERGEVSRGIAAVGR